MALLETQEWNARVLATAYGIPSVLLNMALQGGLTYQNPGALGEMWWRFELRPTATRIVNAFTAQMLPRGQWVSVDAADTFAAITELSDEDDPQLSQVAKASPTQQAIDMTRPLSVIGGTPWTHHARGTRPQPGDVIALPGTAHQRGTCRTDDRRLGRMFPDNEVMIVRLDRPGAVREDISEAVMPMLRRHSHDRRSDGSGRAPVGEGRTVDARIVPYNTPADVSDGGPVYREEWADGCFDDQLVAGHRLRVLLNFEHEAGIGGVIGKGVSAPVAAGRFARVV